MHRRISAIKNPIYKRLVRKVHFIHHKDSVAPEMPLRACDERSRLPICAGERLAKRIR